MSAYLQLLLELVRRRPYLSLQAGLCLLLAAANYFLWQEQDAATRQHDQARRKGEEMLHALSDYPQITADLAAVNGALRQIDGNLVVERALEVNLGYFYQLETLSRVRLRQLNQLSALPPPEGNPFKTVPFSLQATGSYAQLINFLRNLESGPRLLRITSYSLGRGDPRTGGMILDLTAEALASP